MHSEHNPAKVAASPPRVTYRLQLHRHFTFNHAKDLIPYLAELGISHLYLSPIFKARTNSMHGYDITDHGALNPEIGDAEQFEALAYEAHRFGMGIILDIVPNHMAVMTPNNAWWQDVLENGPASQYAHYFDIDWSPARTSMHHRLLVPILGDAFGHALEQGEIVISFDEASGSFTVHYHEHQFPLDPREYPIIFSGLPSAVALALPEDDEDRHDFEVLLNDFSHLPARDESSDEMRTRRYRDKEVIKRRLCRICERSPAIVAYIKAVITNINGVVGSASSFDGLARLLDAQAYRLALWRVADDEINYRRFFDVDKLAALRIEIPEVFDAVHKLILELLAAGHVDGLRVDHIDGLHDPQGYLQHLTQRVCELQPDKKPYIVVEKILASDEQLREQWTTQGTTGYEFGALLNRWLTDGQNIPKLTTLYKKYTDQVDTYSQVVYQSKHLVMRTVLAGEVTMLTSQLDRIAQSHRYTSDFTYQALRGALTQVIAEFPIYRTYIRGLDVESTDAQYISRVIAGVRRSSRASDNAIYDFIKSVLMLDETLLSQPAQRTAALAFVMKFQQITGPIMAKGVEDTAFYRYLRLVSANEVGGDPSNLNVNTLTLHREYLLRAQHWPNSLLATSTHDSKRSEDVRCRICVLSEQLPLWRLCLTKWKRITRRHLTRLENDFAPTRNDEYLLLQTLLGIFPLSSPFNRKTKEELNRRLLEYLLKAVREAKQNSSWVNQDVDYENALTNYINLLFTDKCWQLICDEVGEFAKLLAYFGLLNALTTVVVKTTAPGIPDFYQGSELPDDSLVDPDNRRPVDYSYRKQTLASFTRISEGTALPEKINELMSRWQDGHIKMFVMHRLLKFRSCYPAIFSEGKYIPLVIKGPHAEHLLAYARCTATMTALVVVSRCTSVLNAGDLKPPVGEPTWKSTRISLPDEFTATSYIDVISGMTISLREYEGSTVLMIAELFSTLPFAVITNTAWCE